MFDSLDLQSVKNLAWVAGGLVIVIIIASVYFWKYQGKNEASLAQNPNETSKETTEESIAMNEPFEVLKPEEIEGRQVTIKTDKGDIVIQLFGEAPLAASNFISLVNKKFYDGLTFHRREEGFVIQGGDPNGNGTGGPGYKFADEPVTRDYEKGIVAMANSGPNTNGSQFFIMLADYALPKQYTIFGQVTEGIEVVDKIEVGDKMTSVSLE